MIYFSFGTEKVKKNIDMLICPESSPFYFSSWPLSMKMENIFPCIKKH